MARITLETIAEELKDTGWKCLSTEYKNLDSELRFECEEGHEVYAAWKKIRSKRECPICKNNVFKKMVESVKPKPRGAKRVLAFDQATHTTGWAIFDGDSLVRYGTFNTEIKDETARINAIKNWVVSMITNWDPDCVAIEGIQFQEESSGQKMSVTVFQGLARL